ncbi:MAG: cupin domain-containing protein [Bilophila sp.]|nr:cupin domain-containing protein [Bilophila sp.]
MSTLRSIVLCGGSGTRLWPLSRALYPKQFMDLGGHTLFGDTVDRAAALPDSADPLVVCNEEHRFYVAAALQQKGVSGTILLEPKGRNTAPAIALAAFAALSGGDDPLLLVLPSDHVLKPQAVFAEAVAQARACAESGRIVTFGITPDAPETGFGYIRLGEALPAGGYAVARFVEKPDLARAEAMLADGGYLWNSGMFLFRASVYLEELALHAPGIHAACRAAWERHHADQDFIRPDAGAFLSSPADLGSWEAFYEAAPHDGDGNVLVGDVYAEGAENCYLHASKRMVAALGVSDLVVVETADSVLVADRARTQDVKKIVESLKAQGRGEAENHPLVYRPWGSYETLARGERFQVKRIIVKPGGQLSLQKHHHRAEHWVVVEGTAEITVGDKVLLYHEDQSTYIPLGTVHRLKNPGMIPLVIIEIQSGSYLGEDDIVRLEDSYGR